MKTLGIICDILVIVFVVLLIEKLSELIGISWFWVFVPIILWVFIMVAGCVLAILARFFDK
jgi:hypothetical protein